VQVRINNIGAEPIAYIGKEFEEPRYECALVKYHPNRYYGLLEQYLKDGWEDKGSCLYHYHCHIDKKCFLDKETHYVIAFLKYDPKGNSTQLTSVDDRLLYIEENEKKDFFEVYKIADRLLIDQVVKNENERIY